MAKKNYQIIKDAFDPSITPASGDNSKLTIAGFNSKGTKIRVTVTLDIWTFPELVKQMRKILLSKKSEAAKQVESFENAVKNG